MIGPRPAVVEFGTLGVGAADFSVVTIENDSNEVISSITADAFGADFFVSYTDCSELSPFASCIVELSFEPSSDGGAAGWLFVVGTDEFGFAVETATSISGIGL